MSGVIEVDMLALRYCGVDTLKSLVYTCICALEESEYYRVVGHVHNKGEIVEIL
jgi:hypothetical protein